MANLLNSTPSLAKEQLQAQGSLNFLNNKRSQLSLILPQTRENCLSVSSLDKADLLVLGLDDAIYLELTREYTEPDFIQASTTYRLSAQYTFLNQKMRSNSPDSICYIINKVLKSA